MHPTNRHKAVRRMILLWLALLLAGSVVAQTNPFRIRDDLYQMYRRGAKLSGREGCLQVADSLYTLAGQAGDLKAQCLAATLSVDHYNYLNQTKELEQAVERCKEVSRRNNYLQYYYYAAGKIVTHCINKGMKLRALQSAQAMNEQAKKDGHAYGIFSSLDNMGNIYFTMRNFEMAQRYYQEAVDFLQSHPEVKQNASHIYIQLGRMQLVNDRMSQERIDSSFYYFRKALQDAPVDRMRIQALIFLCANNFTTDDTLQFFHHYHQLDSMARRNQYLETSPLKQVRAYKYCFEGDEENALKMAQSMPDSINKEHVITLVYEKFHRYLEAYRHIVRYKQLSDSLNAKIQMQELSELTAETEMMRLKQENTELDLRNSLLALDRTQQQMELERRLAENDRLSLDNRNLEVERLKSDSILQQTQAEQQRVEGEARLRQQQEEARFRAILLTVIIFSLAVLLASLVYYLYRRHLHILELRQTNRQLAEARDRAEGADRMKTMFIQNMSHEIRTPLNAIVGFSQVIASPDMECSEEERDELSHLILHNADLLTTLVGDVLDLASLESGHYVMHLAPHSPNEIAQMALSSVDHRKPDHVRLYSTTDVPNDYSFVTDDRRVCQVLINFLTNAEKYTTQGEICLHCSLSERPGCLTYSVTDTGPGIPPEQAESIFERFKKLDDFKQGTGLGLNICRLIAERLQGEVSVDTRYTAGARFLFVLPLEQA